MPNPYRDAFARPEVVRRGVAIALPSTVSLVWDINAANLDGSNNGTLADSADIGAAVNHGSGSDLTQSNASYKPNLIKGAGPNGVDVLRFTGGVVGDMLVGTNSITQLAFMHSTCNFEIVAVVKTNDSSNSYFLGSTQALTPGGGSFGRSSAGLMNGYISYAAAYKVNFYHASAPSVTNGSWLALYWTAGGVSGDARTSNDGTTFVTSTSSPITSTGVQSTYNYGLGSRNNNGTPSGGISMDLARFLIFERSLTTDERTQVVAYIGVVYGI